MTPIAARKGRPVLRGYCENIMCVKKSARSGTLAAFTGMRQIQEVKLHLYEIDLMTCRTKNSMLL